MIANKIVYFSLLSVSWMSAVSMRPAGRSEGADREIDRSIAESIDQQMNRLTLGSSYQELDTSTVQSVDQRMNRMTVESIDNKMNMLTLESIHEQIDGLTVELTDQDIDTSRLTMEEINRSIRDFQSITRENRYWGPAFEKINPATLEEFVINPGIESLKTAVDNYETSMVGIVKYPVHLPLEPDWILISELNQLSLLVFWIMHYNLDYLKVGIMAARCDHPIIHTIDPYYPTGLPVMYRNMVEWRETPTIEAFTVDILVLLEINNEIRGDIENVRDVRRKLDRYRRMTLSLYETLAKFTQIRTWVPYNHVLFHSEDEINADEANGVRGYGADEIQHKLRRLFNAILSVIASYGSTRWTGDQWFPHIMQTYPTIKAYLVRRVSYHPGHLAITDHILVSFCIVVQEFIADFPPGPVTPRWFPNFLRMLNKMGTLAHGRSFPADWRR